MIEDASEIILAEGRKVSAKDLMKTPSNVNASISIRLNPLGVSLSSLRPTNLTVLDTYTLIILESGKEEVVSPNQRILIYDPNVAGNYSFEVASKLSNTDRIVAGGFLGITLSHIQQVVTITSEVKHFVSFEVPLYRNFILASGLTVEV